jgi:hypothetical protein
MSSRSHNLNKNVEGSINNFSSSNNDNNHSNNNNTSTSSTTRMAGASITPNTEQKKRFLLFVKILFKSLDQSNETSELRENAKSIIADCTRRNRLGDPEYDPLMDAVDRRLRRHVGEVHWRKAHVYMQHYIRREHQQASARSCLRTAMV